MLNLQFLIKNLQPAMSTQPNEMGEWFFPKDEGVEDWKSVDKFEMDRAPFLEKKI